MELETFFCPKCNELFDADWDCEDTVTCTYCETEWEVDWYGTSTSGLFGIVVDSHLDKKAN